MRGQLLSAAVALLVGSTGAAGGEPAIAVGGQLSGWLQFNDEALDTTRLGTRYIPDLRETWRMAPDVAVDIEVSLNLYSSVSLDALDHAHEDSDADLYRAWARCATAQSELRLGLQELNFGPARVLRSLRWFDRVDPRDPLGLTTGVYGLLARHYFLDNANLWLWVLHDNEEPKGLERVGTDQGGPELGGRLQVPLPRGDIALTAHSRRLDRDAWQRETGRSLEEGNELRGAVDGHWDAGIGLWFEAAASVVDPGQKGEWWRRYLTVGADYTFENGVHALVEHANFSAGTDADAWDEDTDLTACMLDYRLGIVDSVTGFAFYRWEEREADVQLGWRRTYDNWHFDLIAFRNSRDAAGTFQGNGALCMATLNH